MMSSIYFVVEYSAERKRAKLSYRVVETDFLKKKSLGGAAPFLASKAAFDALITGQSKQVELVANIAGRVEGILPSPPSLKAEDQYYAEMIFEFFAVQKCTDLTVIMQGALPSDAVEKSLLDHLVLPKSTLKSLSLFGNFTSDYLEKVKKVNLKLPITFDRSNKDDFTLSNLTLIKKPKKLTALGLLGSDEDTKADIGQALNIVGTLSMVDPEAAPFVQAGVQLSEWIFGLGGGGITIDFTPIFAALNHLQTNLLTALEGYMDHVVLTDTLNRINVYAQWLQEFQQELQLLEQQPDPIVAVHAIIQTDGYLSRLRAMSDPNNAGSLFSVIENFLADPDFNWPLDSSGNPIKTPQPHYDNVANYEKVKIKYSALVTAATLYFTSFKYQIMIQQFVKQYIDVTTLTDHVLAADLDDYLTFTQYEVAMRGGTDGKGGYLKRLSPKDQYKSDSNAATVMWARRLLMPSIADYNGNVGPAFKDLLFYGQYDGFSADGVTTFPTKREYIRTTYYDFQTGLLLVRGPMDNGNFGYSVAFRLAPDPKDPSGKSIANGFLFGGLMFERYNSLETDTLNTPCGMYQIYEGSTPLSAVGVPGDLAIYIDGGSPFQFYDREPPVCANPKAAMLDYYVKNLPLDYLIKNANGALVADEWETSLSIASFGQKVLTPNPVEFTLDTTNMTPAAAGSTWAKKNIQVRYGLVCMRKGSAQSDQIWTEWQPANGQECPTLNLPPVDSGMVDCIWIYRQFGIAAPGSSPTYPEQLRPIKVLGSKDKVGGNFPRTYRDTVPTPNISSPALPQLVPSRSKTLTELKQPTGVRSFSTYAMATPELFAAPVPIRGVAKGRSRSVLSMEMPEAKLTPRCTVQPAFFSASRMGTALPRMARVALSITTLAVIAGTNLRHSK